MVSTVCFFDVQAREAFRQRYRRPKPLFGRFGFKKNKRRSFSYSLFVGGCGWDSFYNRKADMALKKVVAYILGGLAVLFFGVTIAGWAVKVRSAGRIAPGVVLWGREVSGMTMEEAEKLLGELIPSGVTEMRCRVLPEMRETAEEAVNENARRNNKEGKGGSGEEAYGFGKDAAAAVPGTGKFRLSLQEDELCLTIETPLVRVLVEDTLEKIAQKSSEVKIWEWLYAEMTGRPLRIRQVQAAVVWEETYFAELLSVFEEILERDRVEATVRWENGRVAVTESKRGFRIDTERAWTDAKRVAADVTARLQGGPVEGLVLRLFLDGTVLMPRLSTAQAEKCNTKIGEFTTAYRGAGAGRAQNIATGAKRLHAKVVLPGEEFSTAAALGPFTEENGYAAGGTYIGGQLSESIGGGVCQLSTTLYNALLRTRLQVTERHSHSMPVGYIPLGQDAAIAGDYKDLKFKNTTRAPVLLLCEATGEEVRVTLYGSKEAMRESVRLECIVTEKTEDGVTVEVYRTEKAEDGAVFRERVSKDRYRYLGSGGNERAESQNASPTDKRKKNLLVQGSILLRRQKTIRSITEHYHNVSTFELL